MFTPENFSFKAFIDLVIERMNLKNAEEGVRTKIEREILRLLDNRIMGCVFNSMTEDNLIQYDLLREQNPEVSDFENLFKMIEEIPALHEIMLKGVNDLADELIYDSQRLDAALEVREKNIANANKNK